MTAHADVLLRVEHLVKEFPVKSAGVFGAASSLRAVDDVSFDVYRGETLGIVGETGSGKSTLARCVLRLADMTSGRVVFDGVDISRFSRAEMRPYRRRMQVVFQDPYGSLNPRRRAGAIITEPFVIHGVGTAAEQRSNVEALMRTVGLDPEHYDRFPREFSGGQRQRIGIARAIALKPELVVCDEPVSALDVSIRAQILNLLTDLQREFGLTYVFISHDLSVVRHLCDRVAVMQHGKIVELASVEDVFARPQHPYTRALLEAIPQLG